MGALQRLDRGSLQMLIVLALLLGVIAGLRAMTAPAALSWAAHAGAIDLATTPFAFMGYRWTPWIWTTAAALELFSDQLPSTPSRKVPIQFATRLLTGGLCGAAVGATGGMLAIGLVAGVVGAIIGTYGGAAARAKLAASFGKDPPAALIEDAVAVIGAVLIVSLV